MREKPNGWLEQCRVREGPLASTNAYGNNGAFLIPAGTNMLQVVVSDGSGWEHVSVCPRNQYRTPGWEEMQFVKGLFWEPDETVIQYHPAESQYVNCHPLVLHLWKPIGELCH
jgi:hypothetical protein